MNSARSNMFDSLGKMKSYGMTFFVPRNDVFVLLKGQNMLMNAQAIGISHTHARSLVVIQCSFWIILGTTFSRKFLIISEPSDRFQLGKIFNIFENVHY